MKTKTIIAMMLALVTMQGLAQTKTATITGYSPALKDGTLVIGGAGSSWEITDSVKDGHFSLTVPVDELSMGGMVCIGEGCPNSSFYLMLKPGVTVNVTGTDRMYPLWKVESPVPEQHTLNSMTEYCRDVIMELINIGLKKDWNRYDSISMVLTKKEMDILPSLPVDAASISKLTNISRIQKNTKDFPYMEQLKSLEASFVARAPKGFEAQLAEIHNYIYQSQVLQQGDKAADVELFDMQGNKHRLFDAFSGGGYVLLDFWGIGCGPCRMSEPEMREVYERMKGKLEIVGINEDDVSTWKNSDFSKRIVWKNWNDGVKGSSINGKYCDIGAVPYYVLLSPDKRIVWKAVGYQPGYLLGLAEALNGVEQDNSSNMQFAVRKVECTPNATTISFRYYTKKGYWFRIVKDSYLTANGKKYKLTAADGIKLDENNYAEKNAFTAKEDYIGEINYCDFTLTFEPFETIPDSFDFVEGDGKGAFVIRKIKAAYPIPSQKGRANQLEE